MNRETVGQNVKSFSNGQSPTVLLDDLIRRKLSVGDPRNSVEVAGALRRMYPSESSAILREERGLPVLAVESVEKRVTIEFPSESEFKKASEELEQDLVLLTTSVVLREIAPQMRGIASEVRKAVEDGLASATLSHDPVYRGRAFSARRLLGDYARLVRILGILRPDFQTQYRRFARSLDQVGNLLLVLMGEALSQAGYRAGGFILQVPLSGIQARRGGVLMALRSLLGSVETAYGDEEYGRGRHGYQLLYEAIEDSNQPDLQPLLTEAGLSSLLNGLVDSAANTTSEALLGLGATGTITIERLRRLLNVGIGIQENDEAQEPPLIAFLVALRLFVDAFEDTRAGARLVSLALPPFRMKIGQAESEGGRRLRILAIRRGELADLIECIKQCSCEFQASAWQAVFDKVLYDLDRAIDLYALGVDDFGDAELRASAYSLFFAQVLEASQKDCCGLEAAFLDSKLGVRLKVILRDLFATLDSPNAFGILPPPVLEELCSQDGGENGEGGENRFVELVRNLAPDCIEYQDIDQIIRCLLRNARGNVICEEGEIGIPPSLAQLGLKIFKSNDRLANSGEQIEKSIDRLANSGEQVDKNIDWLTQNGKKMAEHTGNISNLLALDLLEKIVSAFGQKDRKYLLEELAKLEKCLELEEGVLTKICLNEGCMELIFKYFRQLKSTKSKTRN